MFATHATPKARAPSKAAMVEQTRLQRLRWFPALAVISLVLAPPVQGQTGRFDLLGPRVDVHVVRGDQSLPIASVPNLQAGDKLQIHADLPSTQSVHLLLVVAFLRGATNPPPDKWFTRVETWKDQTHNEGITVTVPDEAQQALIFIAPETGGDFSTLKSAVRGRPGTFVRASQDLNEASFEQSRIERYAQAIKQVAPGSPADLLDHSHKLAATLQLKPNEDCFKRAADQQADCLGQSGSALLLDDGHGQTMAQMLTTGPTSDLIGAVAGTPVATAGGAGAYSAYVGTVLDVVRLLTGLHTAKYQYIPAIAFPDGDALNLRLNTAPSFNNPKSVIVIALPAIQRAVSPPLQLQDARHVSCLLQPRLVLPLVGAPLVFATGFAHDLVLHLNEPGPDGRTDLPLVPDAYEGGLLVSNTAPRKPLVAAAPQARGTTAAATPSAAIPAFVDEVDASLLPGAMQGTGVVRGFWGFDRFEGPTLALQRQPGREWSVTTQGDLFTGRSNTVDLSSTGTACVQSIDFADGGAKTPLEWHLDEGPQRPSVKVKLRLEKAAPGGLTLAIRQFGDGQLQKVPVTAYADAVQVEAATAHAGDTFLTLRGTGLLGVKDAQINGVAFTPSQDGAPDDRSLRLEAANSTDGKRTPFKTGDQGTARILLKDGRQLHAPFHIVAARPSVTLLNSSFQPSIQAGLPITLGDPHAIPLDGRLTVALRSESPARFARTEKIEVAAVDGSASTTLSLQDNTLVLQDARTALGYVKPMETFGPSGFGPLQARALADDGSASDWVALGTLTRTPVLHTFSCVAKLGPAQHSSVLGPTTESGAPSSAVAVEPASVPCTVSGSDLYLLDAVSATPGFEQAVTVPAGFAQGTLQVPRPADGHTLYLRLRDDPDHIATVQVDPARLKP